MSSWRNTCQHTHIVVSLRIAHILLCYVVYFVYVLCSQLTAKIIIDCSVSEICSGLSILISVRAFKFKVLYLKMICFSVFGVPPSIRPLPGNPQEWVTLGWQLGWWYVFFFFWCEPLSLLLCYSFILLCILFFSLLTPCPFLTPSPSRQLIIFLSCLYQFSVLFEFFFVSFLSLYHAS